MCAVHAGVEIANQYSGSGNTHFPNLRSADFPETDGRDGVQCISILNRADFNGNDMKILFHGRDMRDGFQNRKRRLRSFDDYNIRHPEGTVAANRTSFTQ